MCCNYICSWRSGASIQQMLFQGQKRVSGARCECDIHWSSLSLLVDGQCIMHGLHYAYRARLIMTVYRHVLNTRCMSTPGICRTEEHRCKWHGLQHSTIDSMTGVTYGYCVGIGSITWADQVHNGTMGTCMPPSSYTLLHAAMPAAVQSHARFSVNTLLWINCWATQPNCTRSCIKARKISGGPAI